MILLINIFGLLAIVFVVYWFWIANNKSIKAAQVSGGEIEITVADGVYSPNKITVKSGEPTKLRFIRKDANPCAGTVVFADFNISEELPLTQAKVIELTPDLPGEYAFTCEMGMYRGKLFVVDNF